MVYNIMTCQGFGSEFFGGCTLAWFGLVVVFFGAVFMRVGIKDMAGYDYSQMWGIVAGMLVYVIIVTFFGSVKWSMLFGVVGALIGGWLMGQFTEA